MSYEQNSTSCQTADRRIEERAATIFRPVLIETDEFAGFCLVRNISSNGMMGDVYTDFASDSPITVQFGCGRMVEGTLLWCRSGRIGVQFAGPIDVAEVLARVSKKELEGKVIRAPRLAMQCSAQLLIGERHLSIELQDISQRGIKAAASFVKPGDDVWVRLEGLDPRKASVRWTQAGTAGLNFIRPLSFDELAQWVVQQQRKKVWRSPKDGLENIDQAGSRRSAQTHSRRPDT